MLETSTSGEWGMLLRKILILATSEALLTSLVYVGLHRLIENHQENCLKLYGTERIVTEN